MAYIRRSSPRRGQPTDPGLAAIQDIYRLWQVDDRWSVRQGRGFTWWAGDFRQHVFVDKGRQDHGAVVYRLSAITELLNGTVPDEATPISVAVLNNFGHRCYAVLLDEHTRAASLATSVFFHRESANWIIPSFAALALLQVIQAQTEAVTYASILGGTPAFSAHPGSGVRVKRDEMLHVVADVYRPSGDDPSRWSASGEFEEAASGLNQAGCISVGDANGLTAETAFGNDTALIRATTSEPLHQLGNGLWLSLVLPVTLSEEDAARVAVELNTAELKSFTRSHLLGGWTVKEGRGGYVPEFASFVPNVIYRSGLFLNLLLSLGLKARWACDEVAPYATDEKLDRVLLRRLDNIRRK